MRELLIEDDPYEEMFQIEDEVKRSGTAFIDDPYPVWAELQAKAPVHAGTLTETMGLRPEDGGLYIPGGKYFSVFSFAAVSDVFTRKDDFGSEFYVDLGLTNLLGDTLLSMDGLRHRRYRNLVQEYFQPAAASGWWHDKVIGDLVDELIGRFETAPGADLNAQLFAPLPMHVVTAGFGLSPSDGVAFRRHMKTTQRLDLAPAQGAAAAAGVDEILERTVRERQAAPQDDIISRLAAASLEEDDGSTRPLTVREIKDFCRLIVFAGGGTTWRQLGVTLFALLNNPEQLAAVKADPSLLPKATLEAARWYANQPLFSRKAKRDTTLHGVDIPKDAVLHLCLGAANRDPTRWADPDSFDLFRPVQRSVSFAAGAHSCLGQHVSRQEMVVALGGLFERFPNLRWDPSQPPARLSGGMLARGPGRLPVLLH